MKETVFDLVSKIDANALADTDILPWGSPIPVFGDLTVSRVATLGLNPSNLEFLDNEGNELDGERRRFHTLNSLKIKDWKSTNENHLSEIVDSCINYFSLNPYDRWFKSLDVILNDLNVSYYSEDRKACHLDIVPFATKSKWGALSGEQKYRLITSSGSSLASLIHVSPIQVLILNGASVVKSFFEMSSENFEKKEMPSWDLSGGSRRKVKGFAYSGKIQKLQGRELNREILILGFNHNIQSSFGVTNKVKKSIAKWVQMKTMEHCVEFIG